MMADEALATSRSGNPNPEASLQMGIVSPGSIFKIKVSVLGATREVSGKRAEVAAKHAENLDAVAKAAEIAAEAVSQAGTIVAIAEPFPLTLSVLIEAGPEDAFEFAKSNNGLPSSEKVTTDLAYRIISVPESTMGALDASITFRKEYEGDMPVGTVKETIFTVGTLVEVFPAKKVLRGSGIQPRCSVWRMEEPMSISLEIRLGEISTVEVWFLRPSLIWEGWWMDGLAHRGCFGIPKPERNRKLMDATTQSVVGRRGPASEGNDSEVFELHMEELRRKQGEISRRDEEIKVLEAIIKTLSRKEHSSVK
ncbi:hypothetical protein GIB67_038654 [Kingdonia uniflora]|uniref:Uncharacterized protein n=1 Tax=Kingdonia uniflora TaxID=39325 RepID=A0A7J7NPL9_9MAGN|nr:hypothetical protein GIB67_038654 [Kingdonia uniflora]